MHQSLSMFLPASSHLLVPLLSLCLHFSSVLTSISPSILQKLASEVRESEAEDLVGALSDLMRNVNDDPRKMRREIIKLVRDPKFQKATDGRRTIKAIKLPSGVVQLLNANLSVSSKKEIIDNVLGLLKTKVKLKDDTLNKKVIQLKGNKVQGAQKVRQEKGHSFDEEPLATYSGSPLNSGDNYFGEFFCQS